jgi:hypothetical protein
MNITTWNLQGGTQLTYLGTLINKNNPDVICLQECGDMTGLLTNRVPVAGFPNSLTGIYQYGLNIYSVVFWYNMVDANPRNSLAVMSRITVNNLGIMVPAVGPGYNPGNPRNLPWMQVNQGGNLITIFSYHAPCVVIADACSYNNAQIAAISAGGGTWAIVADFNADPRTVGFVAPPAGGIVRNGIGTQQSGGLLDYSVTNAGAGYTFVTAGSVVGASDHFPQDFNW